MKAFDLLLRHPRLCSLALWGAAALLPAYTSSYSFGNNNVPGLYCALVGPFQILNLASPSARPCLIAWSANLFLFAYLLGGNRPSSRQQRRTWLVTLGFGIVMTFAALLVAELPIHEGRSGPDLVQPSFGMAVWVLSFLVPLASVYSDSES